MSNPNDPAYPHLATTDDGEEIDHHGMTIRQQFVMAAMQGLLSAQTIGGFKWTEIAVRACIAADYALAEEARTRAEP